MGICETRGKHTDVVQEPQPGALQHDLVLLGTAHSQQVGISRVLTGATASTETIAIH
jgi:hypothetical protein